MTKIGMSSEHLTLGSYSFSRRSVGAHYAVTLKKIAYLAYTKGRSPSKLIVAQIVVDFNAICNLWTKR